MTPMPKPLPKFVSILSVLATVFSALNVQGVLDVLPKEAAAGIVVAAVVLAALSHSLGGAGGKPPAE
jgi:hypothetical protein